MTSWQSEAGGIFHAHRSARYDCAGVVDGLGLVGNEDGTELNWIARRPSRMNERRQWLAPAAGGVHGVPR